MAGAAGAAGEINKFLLWANSDREDLPEYELVNGVLISPKGKILGVDPDGLPFVYTAKFVSEGIGAPIALGAMAAGATAVEACKIAIKYSDGCGGKVISVSL